MILSLLRNAAQDFWRNPLRELVITLLFLIVAFSGIFLGPAAIAYFWHHNPSAPPQPARAFLLTQRLSGAPRLRTCLVLGLILWLLGLLPLWHLSATLGLAWWLIIQPIVLMMLISDRYDLGLRTTLRATALFCIDAPAKAFTLMLFGLLALSGTLLAGVGILITLPIALRAAMRFLETCHPELAGAIQRAS